MSKPFLVVEIFDGELGVILERSTFADAVVAATDLVEQRDDKNEFSRAVIEDRFENYNECENHDGSIDEPRWSIIITQADDD